MSNFERISVSEALDRAGFNSVVEVQREALFGRHTGVPVCCECGSRVEPDGHCTHGHPSVLLAKGLI